MRCLVLEVLDMTLSLVSSLINLILLIFNGLKLLVLIDCTEELIHCVLLLYYVIELLMHLFLCFSFILKVLLSLDVILVRHLLILYSMCLFLILMTFEKSFSHLDGTAEVLTRDLYLLAPPILLKLNLVGSYVLSFRCNVFSFTSTFLR